MLSVQHAVFKAIILIVTFNGLHSANLRLYKGSIDNYKVFSLDDPEPLLDSAWFSLSEQTVIYGFGFGGTATDATVNAIIGAYLRCSNTKNIILLNWEREAANGIGPLLYGAAITQGTIVGKQLGQFLIKCHKMGLNLSNLHLIGHSLGAQVMATTGREVQTKNLIVGRITGADPAGPFYSGSVSLESIDATCARFVLVYITNPGHLGTQNAKATVNVWPNCGSSIQPGCENTPVSLSGTQIQSPDIPADVVRNNAIQDLLDLYQNLINEFKDVHKRTRMLQKENASEIINDIKEMAVERDIVIKRLENVQIHLVDVRDKEDILNLSKLLRIQQERAKELESQYDMQQSQLKTASEQLKRYLNVIHGQSATPKTVPEVIKHLQEEIQLNTYLVKEKLPQESATLQKELNIMQMIATEQHPTRSDVIAVQDKIAAVNGEIERLVQRRLAASDPQEDKLAPFRQQAAVIRRNKEASATRVHELTATLKEHEAMLADLRSQVKQLLGDLVLRGEELKKYVNSLRAKSTLYKRQRANLSTFKVEAGILARTMHILNTNDPTIEMALVNHKKMIIDEDDIVERNQDKNADLAKKSLHEFSQVVAQTAQKLSQVRQEIQPLADKVKPVRQEFQEIQQQYEQKKRIYEAASINIASQMEPLKNQVKELADQLNSKEDEWKNLRQKITKAESLQEVVMFEMKNSMQSPRKPSKMEALKKRVADMEEIVKNLEEEQRKISSRQGTVEEQTRLWENALQLLRCKLKVRAAPAARQERMHITQQTQMLTLT